LGLVHLDSHIKKDTKIVETAFTSVRYLIVILNDRKNAL
jgi:hypothetical protein